MEPLTRFPLYGYIPHIAHRYEGRCTPAPIHSLSQPFNPAPTMTTAPLPWILHLDMDAFYASVEQRDEPSYRGRPVIIGGGDRGVVATCSYEARKFGVRSAMPISEARRLCPKAIYVMPRMGYYQEVSQTVMQVLHSYSPLVEQASIDEAYLDFTGLELVESDVRARAQRLQAEVKETTGLSCSLGLAPVKFLAKIASDMHKPTGFTVLAHSQVPAFLARLPVGKIPGVGKQTGLVLKTLSVQYAADVLRYPLEFWERKLGKAGFALYERAQGIDPRPVTPYTEPKSESAENTFDADTSDPAVLARWLFAQAERVGTRLRKGGRKGRTITLKMKFSDFTQITRSRTLPAATNATRVIYETALALLHEQKNTQRLRLIGVGVSQFGEVPRQLSFFDTPEDPREAKLDATLDALREKFGAASIIRGRTL